MTKATVTNSSRKVATRGTPHAAVATSPDFCWVPGDPVPKPFPNWVESKMLQKGATVTVVFASYPVWTKIGELGPPSEPAHAGTNKGFKSGTYRDVATPTSYSLDVFCEGNAVVRTDDATLQNKDNTFGKVFYDVANLAALAQQLVDASGVEFRKMGNATWVAWDRANNRLYIVTYIKFVGPGATEAYAAAAREQIERVWGGEHDIFGQATDVTVVVKTDAEVGAAPTWDEMMTASGDGWDRVNVDANTPRANQGLGGWGGNQDPDDLFDANGNVRNDSLVAAHEYGHTLGIDDQYTDAEGGGSVCDPTKTSNTVGNIMCQTWPNSDGTMPTVLPEHYEGMLGRAGFDVPAGGGGPGGAGSGGAGSGGGGG